MDIFVTNKNFSIKYNASTEYENGFKIVSDKSLFSLETGSSVFECTIFANDMDHRLLKNTECGEFIFINSIQVENTYEMYQIISTDYNTWEHTISIYAESAGLELLGSVAEAWASPYSMNITEVATHFLPSYWNVNNIDLGNLVYTVSWEGEASVVERLLDIADKWDARMFYTFTIENWQLTKKTVNFCSRSSKRSPIQLDSKEINNINITKTLENFCTAFKPIGATPDAVEDNKTLPPIDLKGFTYSYTDSKGDYYYVDTTSGLLINRTQRFKWSGPLNESGLIIRPYSYDTLNKAMLAGQARAELQKVSHPKEAYSIDLQNINKNITIDDYVSIYIPEEDINLVAKVTQIEVSRVANTNKIDVEVI